MENCFTICLSDELLKLIITLLAGTISFFFAVAGYLAYKRLEWLRGAYVSSFERIDKYRYKTYQKLSDIPEEFSWGLSVVRLFGDPEDIAYLEAVDSALIAKGQAEAPFSLNTPDVHALLLCLKRKMDKELDRSWWPLAWYAIRGFPKRGI